MASIRMVRQRDQLPLLLCGYYGEHNLGDDALLEVLLSQRPADTAVIVTAHDELQVQQRHDVATVNRRSLKAVLKALGRSRALVLGGGSLLQDSTSFNSLLYYAALICAARLQGKPVLLWGQGLGPLRRRRSRALVRALLPLVQAIRWRDRASADLAASLGRREPYGSDPVWASESQPWGGSGGPIVVCFRPTPLLDADGWRPYLQALADLAETTAREVIWVPFHAEQDHTLFADLVRTGAMPEALARRSRQVSAQTPREARAMFATAGLVIAMRLHGLILAAVSGAPVAALSYDPKVQAAAADLGCPCQNLDQAPQAPVLLSAWQAQLDRPGDQSHLQALRAQGNSHASLFKL
jgi:polysaccharide pyruvyl transferase CsaB